MPTGTVTRHLDRLALAGGDLVQSSPDRRRRGHGAQGLGLVAQDADIGDGLATISEHHRDVDQYPAMIMEWDESLAGHGPDSSLVSPT